jgi:peptidoglycan/LPS O-acetylase OafA/YrhL
LFRYFYLSSGYGPDINLVTHARADVILMGCMLAFIYPSIKELSWKVEIILSALMFLFYYIGLYHGKGNFQVPAMFAFGFTSCGFASCLLMIIALKGSHKGIRRFFKNQNIARLGVLSYGVYLIHFHVSFITFYVLSKYPVIQDQNIVAVFNLIVPFIPAWFMYFYIDEFFAKFKRAH